MSYFGDPHPSIPEEKRWALNYLDGLHHFLSEEEDEPTLAKLIALIYRDLEAKWTN